MSVRFGSLILSMAVVIALPAVVCGQAGEQGAIGAAPPISVLQPGELPAPQPLPVNPGGPKRPSLGIIAEERLGDKEGMVIISVRKESPADRAGVRTGDVLMAINAQATNSIEDVKRAVGTF